jgi:hypothetical protein
MQVDTNIQINETALGTSDLIFLKFVYVDRIGYKIIVVKCKLLDIQEWYGKHSNT